MSIELRACRYAGGIQRIHDKIICGGASRVVGENAKYYLTDKFLQLKYLSRSKNIDGRKLLKIVGMTLPVTFNRKVYYDDDPTKPAKQSKDINEKYINMLLERINEPTITTIRRIVDESNIRAPLFWALSDLIKYLAVKIKQDKGAKVKISPEVSAIIDIMWDNKKHHFDYAVNSDKVSNSTIDLAVHMLDIIKEKHGALKSSWATPTLIKYPSLKDDNGIRAALDEKKKSFPMAKSGDAKCGVDEISEHVLAILEIEKILSNHIERVEQYYIAAAKNIIMMHDQLKKFFK